MKSMNEKINILFVEDDDIISSGLSYTFESEGYAVTHCENVQSAVKEIVLKTFDIAVLDISLPDGNGFEICKAIKEKEPAMPVIFLTAVDDESNTVKGLEMGADDYITKPFRVKELIARIKAVLRRVSARNTNTPESNGIFFINDVEIHASKCKVYKGGEEIALTSLEYRLLLMLARNRGQILSRNRLLEVLWDSAGGFVNDNTLTVCIKRLREKLGDDSHEPKIIETVRGLGYRAGV